MTDSVCRLFTLCQLIPLSKQVINSMELEEVLSFIKQIGVPYRHPHSAFYKAGNHDCQSLKPYGICDFDEEEFYHQPYPSFSCHIPGCDRTFETVIQYESHYNSCHSFTCNECKKNLPNPHLLDLHISETHDVFFMSLAQKKPMYKCFLEECKETFKTPKERKDHCIKIHKFPGDFRFDSTKKTSAPKKKKKEKNSGKELMDTAENSEDSNSMDTSEPNKAKTEAAKKPEFKGFSFGRPRGKRKPVLFNFSKDLMNSLPE